MKMLLILDYRIYKKKIKEGIALANFIEILQKQADEEIFPKN